MVCLRLIYHREPGHTPPRAAPVARAVAAGHRPVAQSHRWVNGAGGRLALAGYRHWVGLLARAGRPALAGHRRRRDHCRGGTTSAGGSLATGGAGLSRAEAARSTGGSLARAVQPSRPRHDQQHVRWHGGNQWEMPMAAVHSQWRRRAFRWGYSTGRDPQLAGTSAAGTIRRTGTDQTRFWRL